MRPTRGSRTCLPRRLGDGTRVIERCQLRCGAVAKAAAKANVTQDIRCLSCLQNLCWPTGLGTTTIVPYGLIMPRYGMTSR